MRQADGGGGAVAARRERDSFRRDLARLALGSRGDVAPPIDPLHKLPDDRPGETFQDVRA